MKGELDKLMVQVINRLYEQDNSITENKFTTDRVDRMYQAMKEDVKRHETLCYELATKFEAQHIVLLDLASNIEALKTYT